MKQIKTHTLAGINVYGFFWVIDFFLNNADINIIDVKIDLTP